MKITIEHAPFPSVLKVKLNKHINKNVDIKYLSGSVIKFNNTNLSIMSPHKIIVYSSNTFLIGCVYQDEDYIYIENTNEKLTVSKFISYINSLNFTKI